jgi:glycosyltransferase involved in cell wall biosynthesis
MKICVIGNDYKQQFPLCSYGGIESCVENLCIGMRDYLPNGNKFSAIVPKILTGEKDYGFKIIQTKYVESSISGVSFFEFGKEINNYIKNANVKPDIIWSQSAWSAKSFCDLNIPVIITIHDSCGWEENKFIFNENVYYRFVSKFLYDHVLQDANNNEFVAKIKSKSFWGHSGLIDDEYDFEPNKEDYVLWVAGFNWGMHGKGLDILIELSKKIPEQKFVVYGMGDNNIENYLKDLNKNLKNFEFRGKLNRGEDHKKAFKKARLFAMLSRVPEAFGRTGLEAISKGTPVIGTNIGSIPEQVNYENVGYCSNNIDDLAEAIKFKKFDNLKCFEYSKNNYHIKNEINFLLEKSRLILNK